MTDPSRYAIQAIDELTQTLNWLAASLLPGTSKPYHQPMMTPEARAARAMEDRAFKLQAIIGGTLPLGESPAPCDLNVLDLLSEILTAADEMAEQVAAAVHRPAPRPANSAFTDPTPYLQITREHLPLAAATDDTIARWVEKRCDDLIYRAHQQLGILGDGQVLKCRCPWCHGRTATQLAGEHTMRVKAVLPVGDDGRPLTLQALDGLRITMDQTGTCPVCAHPAGKHHDGDCQERGCPCEIQIRWFVVCFGLNCAPPSEDCGEENYWRGRPAWDLASEGAWLAQRLEWASAS